MVECLFVTLVLATLEISLSFDNALINAKILAKMDVVWRRYFLTWGIIIAVFGMRALFPLLLVACIVKASPWFVLKLALFSPAEYASLLQASQPILSGFGGTFLLLIGLRFFIDSQKDVHWLPGIEPLLSKLKYNYLSIISLVVIIAALVASALDPEKIVPFVGSALIAIILFSLLDWLGNYLQTRQANLDNYKYAGLGLFVYLEILDASFSFDGVIGAFALSNQFLIVMLGLAIGAFYVRSFTLLILEKGVLNNYIYLEHGAFYAILVLGILMYGQAILHISEMVAGGSSLLILLTAFLFSCKANKSTN